MKLHLSANVGDVTITICESVYWTAMVVNPHESEQEQRLKGERPDITGISREAVIREVADALVTIHFTAVFTASQIRAHDWLVEPMRDCLMQRMVEIDNAITHHMWSLHPDSLFSMRRGLRLCSELHAQLSAQLSTEKTP